MISIFETSPVHGNHLLRLLVLLKQHWTVYEFSKVGFNLLYAFSLFNSFRLQQWGNLIVRYLWFYTLNIPTILPKQKITTSNYFFPNKSSNKKIPRMDFYHPWNLLIFQQHVPRIATHTVANFLGRLSISRFVRPASVTLLASVVLLRVDLREVVGMQWDVGTKIRFCCFFWVYMNIKV